MEPSTERLMMMAHLSDEPAAGEFPPPIPRSAVGLRVTGAQVTDGAVLLVTVISAGGQVKVLEGSAIRLDIPGRDLAGAKQYQAIDAQLQPLLAWYADQWSPDCLAVCRFRGPAGAAAKRARDVVANSMHPMWDVHVMSAAAHAAEVQMPEDRQAWAGAIGAAAYAARGFQ